MRKSASEIIRNLEKRITRLEKMSKSARQYIPSESEAIEEQMSDYHGWKIITGTERRLYLMDVWEMYVKTYQKIGITMSGPDNLNKYKVWYIHFDDGTPVAFNLFKKTSFGLKSGLSGSNMSSKGKAVSKSWIKTRWKTVPNFYGEVSGAVEHISVKSGVPVLCASYVESILGKPVKGFAEDNVHYLRSFAGKPHMKLMIGSPRGVKGLSMKQALASCPIPQDSNRLARHEKTSALEDRLASDCSIYENSLFLR